MDNSIIVPRKTVAKDSRPPGGSSFQAGFWKSFNDAPAYEVRKRNLSTSIDSVLKTSVPDNKDLYMQVVFDEERATSKSSRPDDIWGEAHVAVVESIDEQTYTISGKKEDFERLKHLVEESSFAHAKGTETRGKTRDMSREVYAIASATDKNTDIENRLDRNMRQIIGEDFADTIECIVELYSNVPRTDYDSIYTQLTGYFGEDSFEKRDPQLLLNNLSYWAKLTKEEVLHMLGGTTDFNCVRIVRLAPNFETQRAISSFSLDHVRVLQPSTGEIVGIIDSGVSHALVDPLRLQHEQYLQHGQTEDKYHGTFVCSRMLFGDQIELIIPERHTELTPIGRYLDVQVSYSNGSNTKVDLDVLKKALREMVHKYRNVRIFNLSITNTASVDPQRPDELTELLDTLQRDYDVLFVCAAGNYLLHKAFPYNDLFEKYPANLMVSSPGDSINALTVGAIAGKSNADSAAPNDDSPSPFTRMGHLRNSIRKPDLVHKGGNYLKHTVLENDPDRQADVSLKAYGVTAISTSGLRHDIGTSFSAPMVTRECVLALDFIKQTNLSDKFSTEGNLANLTRALVIHSSAHKEAASLDHNQQRLAYGFGVPDVQKAFFVENEDKVDILYCDTLSYAKKKHHLEIDLPEFVLTDSTEFIFTFVSSPPVDKNYADYNTLNASANLRVPFINTAGEKGWKYIKPNGEWRNLKWSATDFSMSSAMHFRSQSDKLQSASIQVMLQLNVSKEYQKAHDGQTPKFDLPYAFVLTVIDKSGSSRLRQHMMATNQFDVLVRNEVEVEV